jgi:hypothetical protein
MTRYQQSKNEVACLRTELQDTIDEFQRERADMFMSLRSLNQQFQLKSFIIEVFVVSQLVIRWVGGKIRLLKNLMLPELPLITYWSIDLKINRSILQWCSGCSPWDSILAMSLSSILIDGKGFVWSSATTRCQQMRACHLTMLGLHACNQGLFLMLE